MILSHEFTFDRESLSRLDALRGRRWKCFGAQSMQANLATPFSAFFIADTVAITVTSAVEYYDIDADPNHTTIAELAVAQGADELGAATKSGNVYYFHARDEVADVMVVRETIAEKREGTHTWTVVKDVGIAFVLSGGVIAISQLGLHDEMLQVTLAESLTTLRIPSIQRKWNDVLGIEYGVTRQLISTRELLDAQNSSE